MESKKKGINGRPRQKVSIGRTISGRRGLFTRGMMAWQLDEDEDAVATADRLCFELVATSKETAES